MHVQHFKSLATYGAGALLLSIYGAQVCPFLESLTFPVIFLTLASIFLLAFATRFAALRHFDRRGRPMQAWPWRFLVFDLGLWIAVGLVATGWNMFRYDFPIESGLKIVVGCTIMGILASTYFALVAEEALISACQSSSEFSERERSRFISLSTKFLIFIGASLILFAIVIALLVFKDLRYVLENPSMAQPRRLLLEVASEISFVGIFLLAGCIAIARQYSRNLRMMFGLLQGVFEKVERGEFSTQMPVVTNDELSRIARHTNKMIAGLRDRERIKNIFGKYVSPSVAESIMASEKGSELGGREVHVAILFTDIRNYTTLSEKLSPTEIVDFLNFYFTKVVEAVHGTGGVLDKFIGDAAMAVFGIDGSPEPASAAVNAAFMIRDVLRQVNEHLRKKGHPQIDNGVGIHYGAVIAGNIGSSQRLEYTVIGDAVNVASRIEGLCKTQPCKILISAETHEQISSELKKRFVSLGEFDLKGKSIATMIYGANGS